VAFWAGPPHCDQAASREHVGKCRPELTGFRICRDPSTYIVIKFVLPGSGLPKHPDIIIGDPSMSVQALLASLEPEIEDPEEGMYSSLHLAITS